MSAIPAALDVVAGLPLHPLVVHAAVVLYPLGVLVALACVLVPRLRRRFGLPAAVLLLAGAGAVLLAKESGEALAAHTGTPRDHARVADLLTLVSLATAVVGVGWWAAQASHARAVRAHDARPVAGVRPRRAPRPPLLGRVLGMLLVPLALGSLVLTVVVGHSGATAAWADRLPAADPSGPSAPATGEPSSPGPTDTPTPTPTEATTPPVAPSTAATAATPATPATPTPTALRLGVAPNDPTQPVITLAQVGEHRTEASCWAVVDGSVYDLSGWVARHPGGPEAIRRLCGTDASRAFDRQHAGMAGPEKRLASLRIGRVRR